ncbi:MAG: alpha/beta hydrolase [Rhodomicrobiaceae bacterium]
MMTLLIALLAIAALLVAGLVLFTALTARRVERALPPRGRFLNIEGARLHYLDVGQGPAIVMIHGLGGQMQHFTYALLDRLARDFRVVLIDRPGSGYSIRLPGASARLRAQGDVIDKAIRALKLEKPLLVGHSMGGAVALATALDHPESVGGLALVAPLTQPVEKSPAPFEALVIQSDLRRWLIAWTFATPMSIIRGEKILAAVFDPDPAPRDFPMKAGGLLSLRPSAFQSASLDLVSANADLWDMVKRYPALSLPVSILYGTDDRVLDYRTHGLAMKDRLPAVDVELTGGGHMLPLAAPDLTADFIRKAARKHA